MRRLTATLAMVTGTLAMLAVTLPQDAHAVAGFSRQTGMTCNMCHTLHGAPTPNFTFTGKKFNALGYRLPGGFKNSMSDSQEQGKPEDKGEYFKLLPTSTSARFQYQIANTSEPPGADSFGPVITNPTSRLAFFPFTGPVGDHFGIWTEFYITPFTSEDNEWGIADTSYEEFDFRYVFDTDDDSTFTGLAISNQGVASLFGFSPFPGLPSEIGRGGVGGYSHPNWGGLYAYGWRDDRWVWGVGAETGDTNYDWDDSNIAGVIGYAARNRNDDELWYNLYFRTGDDALPMVTSSGAQASSRSWQYRDAVGGVSATRTMGGACPGVSGRRVSGSCAYLAEELDDHTSIDLEIRRGGQNVDKFFGEKAAGPWSFEYVARLSLNDEDYNDGASAERNSWGFETVIGYKHTHYFKPAIYGDFDFEFTDSSGVKHDIDTKLSWSLRYAYKATENFLLYAQYANSQRNSLDGKALTGKSFSITADISF